MYRRSLVAFSWLVAATPAPADGYACEFTERQPLAIVNGKEANLGVKPSTKKLTAEVVNFTRTDIGQTATLKITSNMPPEPGEQAIVLSHDYGLSVLSGTPAVNVLNITSQKVDGTKYVAIWQKVLTSPAGIIGIMNWGFCWRMPA
jgi:hypothetical protein